MTMPISILMPMKNSECYVAETIQSILAQTFPDFELIVVDDRSDDSSRQIVENISDDRIKIIQGKGNGISSAFNFALHHAKGDVVVRCDADDLYPLDRLKIQLDWLHSHPDYGAVCGAFSSLDHKGKFILDYDCGDKEESVTQELRMGKTRTHYCTFAVRKSVLDDLGGCREYFITAEDIDLQLRLAERCEVYYLPKILYRYRLYDDSTIHSQSTSKRKFFDEQAHLFQIQRKEAGTDDLQHGIIKNAPYDYGGRNRCDVQIQGNLLGLAWKQHASGQKYFAIKTGLKACLVKPSSIICWKSFVMLLIK